MTDTEVVYDDIDTDSEEQEDGRKRRWWVAIAAVLLLMLLMFCCVSAAEVWLVGGAEQARFIARNVECLQCHTELIPDFRKESVHNPFAIKDCQTCHTPHGKKVTVAVTEGPSQLLRRWRTMIEWLPLNWWFTLTESETTVTTSSGGAVTGIAKSASIKGAESHLIMPEDELCWVCHGSMGTKLRESEFQHQPFEAGRCTGCHNPHASDNRALLTQAANRICFTCHPMGMELNRAQAHQPVEQGWCIDCHDPHASDYKGVLVAGQRELCFRCHPTVAVKSGMPVQHAPFVNDNCTGCHQPHGSDFKPLLNRVQPDLCYDCHPEIVDQFALPSTHPVGLKMECGSCHDPHAAQYRGLISAQNNDFCYECHTRIETTFVDSDHRGQLCVRCHTPHGSKYSPMLTRRNPDLCFNCHDASDYDQRSETVYRNKHPVRPTYYDVNNESPLTCTSSCHNPHGTGRNHMLRYFSSPKDGGCLMCHAVTEGSRVGIDY